MTLQEQLADAEAAYHNLMTGKSARVVVDGADGGRVEFTAANKAGLYSYIKDLKAQIGVASGTTNYLTNGPAQFVF